MGEPQIKASSLKTCAQKKNNKKKPHTHTGNFNKSIFFKLCIQIAMAFTAVKFNLALILHGPG